MTNTSGDTRLMETIHMGANNKLRDFNDDDMGNIMNKTNVDTNKRNGNLYVNNTTKKSRSVDDDVTNIQTKTANDFKINKHHTAANGNNRNFDTELNRIQHYTTNGQHHKEHITNINNKTRNPNDDVLNNAIINTENEIKIDHKTMLENMIKQSMDMSKVDVSGNLYNTDMNVKISHINKSGKENMNKTNKTHEDTNVNRYDTLEETVRKTVPGGNGIVNYKQMTPTKAKSDVKNNTDRNFEDSVFTQMRHRREHVKDNRQKFDREGVDYDENVVTMRRTKRNGDRKNLRHISIGNDINSGEKFT
jgi:hypothetical protein